MFLDLIIVPSSSAIIAGVGAYSSTWFNELLPWAWLAIGIFFAGMLASAIIGVFWSALDWAAQRLGKKEE